MSDRVDLAQILKEMPKRAMKRTTIDLPEDQINVVDVCAKALGLSRGNFLLLWFDSSARAMVDWTNTLLGRSQFEIVENDEEAEKK